MAQVAYHILATIWKREVFHQILATVRGSTLSFRKSEEALGLWPCHCSPQGGANYGREPSNRWWGWEDFNRQYWLVVVRMFQHGTNTGGSSYILIARKQLQLSGLRPSIPRRLMSCDILLYQNYCIGCWDNTHYYKYFTLKWLLFYTSLYQDMILRCFCVR